MPSLAKEIMYAEITREFKENPYIFISAFQGLTVADFSDLRRNLEKVSHRSMVVKHSLAQKVFSEIKVGDVSAYLKKSVLVTLGRKDPQNISKVILDFSKTNDKFASAAVVFESKVYGQEFVKRLAQLPSRKELLTQVAVRVKSPITGLVLTLNQLVRGVVVALNEIKKKKEAAQPAAS